MQEYYKMILKNPVFKKDFFSSKTIFENPFEKMLQGSQLKYGLIEEYQPGTTLA
jgi:hypothetical protein